MEVTVLGVSHTDQIDTQIDRQRESWRDVAQQLTIAAGMQPADNGHTDDYRLADCISGY